MTTTLDIQTTSVSDRDLFNKVKVVLGEAATKKVAATMQKPIVSQFMSQLGSKMLRSDTALFEAFQSHMVIDGKFVEPNTTIRELFMELNSVARQADINPNRVTDLLCDENYGLLYGNRFIRPLETFLYSDGRRDPNFRHRLCALEKILRVLSNVPIEKKLDQRLYVLELSYDRDTVVSRQSNKAFLRLEASQVLAINGGKGIAGSRMATSTEQDSVKDGFSGVIRFQPETYVSAFQLHLKDKAAGISEARWFSLLLTDHYILRGTDGKGYLKGSIKGNIEVTRNTTWFSTFAERLQKAILDTFEDDSDWAKSVGKTKKSKKTGEETVVYPSLFGPALKGQYPVRTDKGWTYEKEVYSQGIESLVSDLTTEFSVEDWENIRKEHFNTDGNYPESVFAKFDGWSIIDVVFELALLNRAYVVKNGQATTELKAIQAGKRTTEAIQYALELISVMDIEPHLPQESEDAEEVYSPDSDYDSDFEGEFTFNLDEDE